MVQRYNERYPVVEEGCVHAGVCFMKYKALLLSLILAAGVSLSLPAFGQDDKQKQTPPSQSQTQPANDQSQAQTQPGNDQSQSQPAADQSQTASTPDQDAQDKDGKDKDADKDKDAKGKHDGGKKDVDAIGNRKVGGMDWYSIETDIKIGKSYAQQIETSMKMIQDPVVTEYVNRIGQNLVRNSDAKVPFTIKVVDADDVNAMALPGGFFYVNSGLILAADDEAELAAVMAHEIAHVALRHATRGQTRADIANIATIPLIFLGGGIGYAARQAAGI